MHSFRTLILLAPFLAAPAQAAPPIEPLFQSAEELTGHAIKLHAISNDGKVFSGTFVNGGMPTAYRYSAKDGFQILASASDLPADTEGVWEAGMSDEGKLIYGHLQYDEGGVTYLEGFVWTTTGGFQRMGLPSGATSAVASSVSGNNKTLGGQFEVGGQQSASIWTQRDGFRSYDSLFPDFPAGGTSPDWISNKLNVAWVTGYNNGFRTMRWVKGKGTITYTDLAGGSDSATLNTVTANGRLGFGSGDTDIGHEAISFGADGSVTRLFPQSEFQSMATATALGGRLVAGYLDKNLSQSSFRGSDSFFIDRKTGKITFLSDLFAAHVPAADGWTDMTMAGLSANGNILIGSGLAPGGQRLSWILTGVKKLITGKPAK